MIPHPGLRQALLSMRDFLLYGIFALEAARDVSVNKIALLELFRTPLAINAGILGAFLVPFVPQTRVRDALTCLSVFCLIVFAGLIFTFLVILACCLVFALSRLLSRWAQRRGEKTLPLVTAWLFVNALYAPVFFVILPPFRGQMSWGEVALFWGPAFLVFKSIHYIHAACKGHIDPHEPPAFRHYILYMIHFASFRFGPFQKFRQFDDEVETCKQRLTWENRLQGLFRIGLAIAKYLVIFHWINRKFFYPHGYFGPFAEGLFENASTADPGHLWLMLYLFMFRLILFISALSDGVIGMNLLMGIRVPENSNWPLISRDILEFWRRWHVQAMAFFRDEVFFPIGGLRNRIRGYFCVFAYSGFWHFPSVAAVILFPLIQVVTFEGTIAWIQFWKRHERANDQWHVMRSKLYLHRTYLSQGLGILIVFHIMALSVLLLHDHKYGGTTMLPRMFGF